MTASTPSEPLYNKSEEGGRTALPAAHGLLESPGHPRKRQHGIKSKTSKAPGRKEHHINPREAADVLRMSISAIYWHLKNGTLKSVRRNRHWLISPRSLMEFAGMRRDAYRNGATGVDAVRNHLLNMEGETVSPREAAAILDLSLPGVYARLSNGTLKAFRIGGKLLIPRETL